MKITTAGTQKEAQIIEVKPKQNPLMHYTVEYDSTHPEDTIKKFIGDIRNMLSKYEQNKSRLLEIEHEQQDLLHYIEIASFKTGPKGYKLYRQLAELRRERRACKSENDLLKPIFDFFKGTAVLDKLSNVQGECGKAKETIDARFYAIRSDILENWLNPKKEEPVEDEVNENNDVENVDIQEEVSGDDDAVDTVDEAIEEAENDMIDKVDIRAAQAKFKLAWVAGR